MIMKSGVKS